MYSITTVAIGLLGLALYLLYRAALPKPIPGIPYVKEARINPLGNLPLAMKHKAKSGVFSSYFFAPAVELGEPLVQIFMKPFGRPWLLLCDSREAQDLMTNRTREFDLSDFAIDLHRAPWPYAQASMRTTDRWRANRRMMGEVLSPKYIGTVGLTAMHQGVTQLLRLMDAKTYLAKDSIFDIKEDLKHATADIIWQFAYGNQLGAVESQLDVLSKTNKIDRSLLNAGLPPLLQAIIEISNSSQIPLESPLGYLHHWLALKLSPRLRHATQVQDKRINKEIKNAMERLATNELLPNECALASMLRRLRPDADADPIPEPELKYVFSELALMMHAGQKTTADTVAWGMKYLAVHQDVQAEIRSSLKSTFGHASNLTPEAIISADLPFLDAFENEVLRHRSIVPCHVRIALEDTQILGHFVPKGTNVFMPPIGPSYTSIGFEIDEKKRSITCQNTSKTTSRTWGGTTDLESFRPNRWLVHQDDGRVVFDSRVAPMLTFAEGPRACPGMRFALLEKRVILCMVLMNFEVQPLPEAMVNFLPVDFLTIEPKNCLVKLVKI